MTERDPSVARKIVEFAKYALHALFGDYQYWKVYSIGLPQSPATLPQDVRVLEIQPGTPVATSDPALARRLSYGGEEAHGFGLFTNNELATVLWYWWGDRYQRARRGRSWTLPDGAAKLVGLYTAPEFRGLGYALILQRQSAHIMGLRGFTRLYARIWHSNSSSIRVFEKAGWQCVGSYVELCPLSTRIQFRLPF